MKARRRAGRLVFRMTSIIRLNPLSGGGDESPHCYLLEVDGFNFLLDIGWDEKFSPAFIARLEKVVPRLDAVLLSYPDIEHLGALPVAVGRLGLSCPIYATVPVYKMGQMFLYDLYQVLSRLKFDSYAFQMMIFNQFCF